MSSYRDDTMETAVAIDQTWMKLRAVVTDSAKATDRIFYKIIISISDSAIVSDELLAGGLGYLVTETAHVSDEVAVHRFARNIINEKFKIQDIGFYKFYGPTTETALVTDFALNGTIALVQERIRVVDSDLSQRKAKTLVRESARIRDFLTAVSRELTVDQARAYSNAYGKAVSRNISSDFAEIRAMDLSHVRKLIAVMDKAMIRDDVFHTLKGKSLSREWFFIEDSVLGFGNQDALIWTARSDTWGMSRYEQLFMQGLSVMNGQLFGWNEQGVWLYGSQNQQIHAQLKTAKMDFGENLVHPVAAYLEYQLSGQQKKLSVSVGTTQSGHLAQYSYSLVAENSDELTNGRVIFGRGLRGRHFSFDIDIQAYSAQINALSVDFSQTTRRI